VTGVVVAITRERRRQKGKLESSAPSATAAAAATASDRLSVVLFRAAAHRGIPIRARARRPDATIVREYRKAERATEALSRLRVIAIAARAASTRSSLFCRDSARRSAGREGAREGGDGGVVSLALRRFRPRRAARGH